MSDFTLITKSEAIDRNSTLDYSAKCDDYDNLQTDFEALTRPVDIEALIELRERSCRRFDFDLHPSGRVAEIVYRDYAFSSSKLQEHKTRKHYAVKPIVREVVQVA